MQLVVMLYRKSELQASSLYCLYDYELFVSLILFQTSFTSMITFLPYLNNCPITAVNV